MTPPDPAVRAAAAAAIDAAKEMQWLDPGPMAELRRMQPDNPAPAFWRIAVRHDTMTKQNRDKWVHILRILALLTPKGEAPPGGRPSLHEYKRRLGEVLCDGGDPEWKPPADTPDGVVSEKRLIALLSRRGADRQLALERAMRIVAPKLFAARQRIVAKRGPGAVVGINVTHIARAILWPREVAPIADAYFRRLDRATRAPSEETSE